jgi:hypothetical protein
LEPSQVLFSQAAIPWDRWVAFWQHEQAVPGSPPEPIAAIHVLPHTLP